MQRERYYILNRIEGKQPAMCKPTEIVSIKAVNMVNTNGSVTQEPKRLKITVWQLVASSITHLNFSRKYGLLIQKKVMFIIDTLQ